MDEDWVTGCEKLFLASVLAPPRGREWRRTYSQGSLQSERGLVTAEDGRRGSCQPWSLSAREGKKRGNEQEKGGEEEKGEEGGESIIGRRRGSSDVYLLSYSL